MPTSIIDRICKFFNHPFRSKSDKHYDVCSVCKILIDRKGE